MLPDHIWPVSVNDHVAEPAGLWAKRLDHEAIQIAEGNARKLLRLPSKETA
jgi:hypothetical protein